MITENNASFIINNNRSLSCNSIDIENQFLVNKKLPHIVIIQDPNDLGEGMRVWIIQNLTGWWCQTHQFTYANEGNALILSLTYRFQILDDAIMFKLRWC